MKKLLRACTLIAALITSGTATAAATDYAIGTDLIRWLDPVQDGGMASLTFQKALGREDALFVDLAQKDDRTMLGLDYKVYNQRYYYGSFFQVGVLLDFQNSTRAYVEGAMGYEFSPAQNWVVSGDVQMSYGSRHLFSEDEDSPIFLPRLRLMYAF